MCAYCRCRWQQCAARLQDCTRLSVTLRVGLSNTAIEPCCTAGTPATGGQSNFVLGFVLMGALGGYTELDVWQHSCVGMVFRVPTCARFNVRVVSFVSNVYARLPPFPPSQGAAFAADWSELRSVTRNRLVGRVLPPDLASAVEAANAAAASAGAFGVSTTRYLQDIQEGDPLLPPGARLVNVSLIMCLTGCVALC